MTRDEQIISLWPAHSLTEIAVQLGVTRNVVAGVLRRAGLMGAQGAYQRELAERRMAPRSRARTGSYKHLPLLSHRGPHSYSEEALTETWAERKARKEREKNGTAN